MSRTWIYHKTESPKIVDESEAEKYYSKGWADTPAKFINLKDIGVDPDDPVKVQQFGEAVEGVKKALNYQLMTNAELRAYAKKEFDVELGNKLNKDTLIEEIEALNVLKGTSGDDSPESN